MACLVPAEVCGRDLTTWMTRTPLLRSTPKAQSCMTKIGQIGVYQINIITPQGTDNQRITLGKLTQRSSFEWLWHAEQKMKPKTSGSNELT